MNKNKLTGRTCNSIAYAQAKSRVLRSLWDELALALDFAFVTAGLLAMGTTGSHSSYIIIERRTMKP